MTPSVTRNSGGIPRSRLQFRQLMVVKHNPHLSTNTVHMLVRSTAPTIAEAPALAAKDWPGDKQLTDPQELYDETDEALNDLREKLGNYIQSNTSNPEIKIALNIHGYSTPLLNFANNAYEVSDAKFCADNLASVETNTPRDFVIFIDFSWPSEQALSLSPIRTISAMPVALWFVLLLAVAFAIAGGGSILIAGVLLGLAGTLILLRMVTYFRDRDRAATYGAYDAVELIRYLHELIQDLIKEKTGAELNDKSKVELNLLAHSMGCFVATQTVRTLCDVFDTAALLRWRNPEDGTLSRGPFAIADPCASQDESRTSTQQQDLSRIGKIFKLGRLVLASPDIPIWALSSGRSNPLLASMRRFEEVFVFTNDADMVLRLASTLANFFVFPSGTQKGGYRLGNAVNLPNIPAAQTPPWGVKEMSFKEIGFYAPRSGLGAERENSLHTKPFFARLAKNARLRLINCTDYRDTNDIFDLMKTRPGRERQEALIRHLRHETTDDVNFAAKANPRLAATGKPGSIGRYAATFIQHFLARRLDSHGGYFQGSFCLGLLYGTLLNGGGFYTDRPEKDNHAFNEELKRHQLTWIKLTSETEC
jgi:pimeloyl-ACP methyl ester carboxylesterase